MTADLDIAYATRSLESWAAEAAAAAGIARSLAPTPFVPDSLKMRNRDGTLDLDGTVAQVAAALLTGQELGLPPMGSLRSIDVIPPGTGSPALRANAMRALAMSHGHEIWFAEPATDTRVRMLGRRAGSDPDLPPVESLWTWDRARQMKLRGFNSPDSQWQRQPRTMLTARSTAEIVRLVAPDVLLGLPYAVEELDAAGVYDAGVEGEQDSAADRAAPARHSTARRPRSSTTRRRTAAPALPAPAQSPAGEDGEPGAEARAAPVPMITRAQRATLWAGLRRLGLTEREAALGQIGAWLNREVASSGGLTEAEADAVIEAIGAEERRRDALAAAEDAAQRAEAEAAQDAAEVAEFFGEPAGDEPSQEEPD